MRFFLPSFIFVSLNNLFSQEITKYSIQALSVFKLLFDMQFSIFENEINLLI